MTDSSVPGVDRSREELAAARLLTSEGFFAQAVSRAYYAVFYCAEVALQALGETRSKHSGVLSAFNRLVVKQAGFDREVGGLLYPLFEDRNEADYAGEQFSAEEARDALANAERFVDAVERWLEERD